MNNDMKADNSSPKVCVVATKSDDTAEKHKNKNKNKNDTTPEQRLMIHIDTQFESLRSWLDNSMQLLRADMTQMQLLRAEMTQRMMQITRTMNHLNMNAHTMKSE